MKPDATQGIALVVSAADFDHIVDPRSMVGDPRRDLGLDT